MGRFVLIVSLLLITSFAWFSFSSQESDDPSISSEPPTRLIANQSDRMRGYSTTDQVPEQVGDPDEKTTTPTPEDLDSVVAVNPDPEERKKDERLVMPKWEKIFHPNGKFKDEVDNMGAKIVNGVPDYIDIYDGTMAAFILEDISNGMATDMTALLPAVKISDEVVYRGEVSAAHDLGNIYFMASMGEDDHARMYVGVERLSIPVDSFIEIEFNQLPVRLGSKRPGWNIKAERKDGDLLVRVNFTGGQPSFVEFEQWQNLAYTLLDTYSGSPGNSCIRQPAFMYCDGMPPIEHPTKGFEVWDEAFQPIEITPPDNFVQVGVDLKRLLGSNIAFSGILIRTPEDIAINGFPVSKQTAFLGAF